ncbi:hypothetical protein [Ideonella sp.]|uniref:hypothetical protein n=1 Tax=Ideonella sp. TaxID=1929293 RepID=UPI0035AF5778
MADHDHDADDGVRRWFYGGTPPDEERPADDRAPPPGARDRRADEWLARAWATATLHRLRGAAATRAS